MRSRNIRTAENQSANDRLLFNEMASPGNAPSYRDYVTGAAILENDIASVFENESEPGCLIQSRREIGLNIFYDVAVTRPYGREFSVSIPWQVQEVCPHCQGQGQVYSWNSDNSAYEGISCEECGGQGSNGYDSEISLFVNDASTTPCAIRA